MRMFSEIAAAEKNMRTNRHLRCAQKSGENFFFSLNSSTSRYQMVEYALWKKKKEKTEQNTDFNIQTSESVGAKYKCENIDICT